MALTCAPVRAKVQAYDIAHELAPALVKRGNQALARLLADGRACTRDQVRAALEKALARSLSPVAVGHLLMYAELDAVVCSGAPAGSKQTYAAFDGRVPSAPPMPRDEALVALATRYFASHAPATMRDFRWWSGLSAADAKRAVANAQGLQTRQVAGLEFIDVDGDADGDVAGGDVHLLQPFDELMVGYTESRHAVDVQGRLREQKTDGLLSRTVLADGQVVGRWTREIGRTGVAMHIALAVPTTRRLVHRIEAAAGRYAAFLARPLASFAVAPL